MQNIERRVWREARAMTRREVITKAIARQLSWVQAARHPGGYAASDAANTLESRTLGI
jgi:hypothetical protein